VESQPVRLQLAEAREAHVLANPFELYAHDLSAAFELDVGADGRFGYAPLASYWKEADRRFAFLIHVGSQLAGFALATRGSPVTSDAADLDVAEFFVLRRQRRSGVGRQSALGMWSQMPGDWIVRVEAHNPGALLFWTRVITDYTEGQFTQRRATGSGKQWTVLSFGALSRHP
jgi:predicted acetyltransferase